MKIPKRLEIQHHIPALRIPNENPAEDSIQQIKTKWHKITVKKISPKRMWDCVLLCICETGKLYVSRSKYTEGRTTIEKITSKKPDSSEYLEFSFYYWVTYCNNYGLDETLLVRWIGLSHKVRQLISHQIITDTGHVISVTTFQRLTNSEMQTTEYNRILRNYYSKVESILDITNVYIPEQKEVTEWNSLPMDEGDQKFLDEFNRVINDENLPHKE